MVEIVVEGPGRNALSTPLIKSLLGAIEDARAEPLLITGGGEAFSAGLDLKEVAALDAESAERFLLLIERFFAAVFDHPAPTVAYVNGHAIAGGCVLALCCDLRIAAPDERIKIGLNEVALGVEFPPKIMRIVEHRVPPRSRHEVVLGAGVFSPYDAVRAGLVDRVGTHEDASAALDRLAGHPRAAYEATKARLRRAVTAVADPDQLRDVRAAVPAWTSDALKQRIAAILGH